jgi:hypothetical protein
MSPQLHSDWTPGTEGPIPREDRKAYKSLQKCGLSVILRAYHHHLWGLCKNSEKIWDTQKKVCYDK